MGCSASTQPRNPDPYFPSRKFSLAKASVSTEEPQNVNGSSHPPIILYNNTEVSNLSNDGQKTVSPISSQNKQSDISSNNALEIGMIPDMNDVQSISEKSMSDFSPKSSLVNLGHKSPRNGFDKTPKHLIKPSTFFREKISSRDLVPTTNQLDRPKETFQYKRRRSLVIGNTQNPNNKQSPMKASNSFRVLRPKGEASNSFTILPKISDNSFSPRKNAVNVQEETTDNEQKAQKFGSKEQKPSQFKQMFNSMFVNNPEEKVRPRDYRSVNMTDIETSRVELPEIGKTPLTSKEKFKIQIEQKFTRNLLDLLNPKKQFREEKKFSQEQKTLDGFIAETKEIKSPSQSEFCNKNNRKKYLINKSLDASCLDVSLEKSPRAPEDTDSAPNKMMPHPPVKKLPLFNSILEGADQTEKKTNSMGPKQNSFNHKSFIKESAPNSIRETTFLDKSVDGEGHKKVNQYIIGKELGRGSFGKVKLGIDSETGLQFAIKIANKGKMQKKLLSKDKNMFSQLQAEIAVMKKLNHPNIVQLYEVIDDPNAQKLYLVMALVQKGAVMSRTYWAKESDNNPILKFCDGESMNSIRLNTSYNGERQEDELENKPLSEEKARKYFRELVLGLDYMHNYANIIHRDIKPENLLIDEFDTLKISDFNVSCILEDSDTNKGIVKNAAGTKTFLAPEAWVGSKFLGQPVDIWAAGATLYYFLYGKPPFAAGKADQLKELILYSEPEFPSNITVSQEAIDLIKACLRKNPNERATISDIFADKWLTKNGTQPLSNEGTEKLVLTEEDIQRAITAKLTKLKTSFMMSIHFKKSLDSARNNIRKKTAKDMTPQNVTNKDESLEL